ncbi:MAG TPA: ATP-binding protein [Kiloniellaceae bacterium]|nr:ATP-binding protein [Kiloniellaceae bacterium]
MVKSLAEKTPHADAALNLETLPGAILNAMTSPLLVVDRDNRLCFVNSAAEQFLDGSFATLQGQALDRLLPGDSPLFDLLNEVRHRGHSISQHGVTLETPKIGIRNVAIDAAPLADLPEGEAVGAVAVTLQPDSIARRLDLQVSHRNVARSVTAMAAILAHEVKNPLSGIRGAAQLLEAGVSAEDRELTRLICDESDRIVALVNHMEMFSDDRPISRQALNIHEVLWHVRRLAESGFARKVRFVERYDPSLPPVYGNRDLLIQAFLNLVKNAAEAVAEQDGEIVLSTRFKQGVWVKLPGSATRVEIPLVVGVQDNGPGIPEDLQANLFDAFVTTKVGGKGLGLALVAKVVGDHGGVIDVESVPRRTRFQISLPIAPDDLRTANAEGENA